jgi:hypothetical protein
MHEIRRAIEAARDAKGTVVATQEYYRATIYRIITGFTWSDTDIAQPSDADTLLVNMRATTDTWKKLELAMGFAFRHATKFKNELRKLANSWIRRSSTHLESIIGICHPNGDERAMETCDDNDDGNRNGR